MQTIVLPGKHRQKDFVKNFLVIDFLMNIPVYLHMV
jgi:hypothetical protein